MDPAPSRRGAAGGDASDRVAQQPIRRLWTKIEKARPLRSINIAAGRAPWGQAMVSKSVAAAIIVTAVLLGHEVDADAAEVKMLCANGMRAVLTELHPQLERTTGQRVTMSFGEAGDLRKRIQDGEMVDVIVLPRLVLDQLLTQGKIVPGTTVDLGQSGMGLGVRTDAPKPDIGSVEAFKRTLLAAKSFARNEGADSGVFMVGLLDRLGIAEQMKAKSTLVRQGFVADLVAKGEVEMAVQQMPELKAVPGVDATPLPPEIQHAIVFCAGIPAAATAPDAVGELIAFLSSPAAATVIRAKGLEPM